MPSSEVLTIKESLVVGAVAGAIEVSANLPFWTIKTRYQSGFPFTLNLKVLYRGYSMALFSMSAITGLQIMSSSILQKNMAYANTTREADRIFYAFAGGALSSILYGPIDLIATQQHKQGFNSYGRALHFTYKNLGIKKIFIGTPATALADGIFTCAYYGVYPYLKTKMQTNSAALSFGTGVVTGIGAAVLSHPIDMIKTIQQREADLTKLSIKRCASDLYHRKNGLSFFKGFLPRTIWLTSAVTITAIAAERVQSCLYPKN